jgi:hypothetical protein
MVRSIFRIFLRRDQRNDRQAGVFRQPILRTMSFVLFSRSAIPKRLQKLNRHARSPPNRNIKPQPMVESKRERASGQQVTIILAIYRAFSRDHGTANALDREKRQLGFVEDDGEQNACQHGVARLGRGPNASETTQIPIPASGEGAFNYDDNACNRPELAIAQWLSAALPKLLHYSRSPDGPLREVHQHRLSFRRDQSCPATTELLDDRPPEISAESTTS